MDILESTQQYEAWLRKQLGNSRTDEFAFARKHEKMADGAGGFLRGAFYHWIRTWRGRVPARVQNAPNVPSIGDLHLENFGTWRDARGRLAWGVNDFDEAVAALPCTHDLSRLAVSARLMLPGDKLPLPYDDVCKLLARTYRETMAAGRAFAHPILLTNANDYAWLHALAQAEQEKNNGDEFWREATSDTDKAKPIRFAYLPPDAQALMIRLWPAEVSLNSIAESSWYLRRVGLGSLGRVRFLGVGARRDVGDKMFGREAKAVVPSAARWARGKTGGPPPISAMMTRAARSRDPHYVFDGTGWVARRIAPDILKIEAKTLDDLAPDVMEKMLAAMARETAHVHLGVGGDRAAGRAAMYLKNLGDDWLHETATELAETITDDFRAWKRHHQTSSG